MHGRLLFRRELVVACPCGCVRSIDGEGVNWVGVGFGAWCAAVNSGRESHAIHGGIYSGDAVGNGWMGDDSALGGRVCRVQAAGATCGCTRRRRRWRRKAGRGGAQPRGPAPARAPTSPFRHFAVTVFIRILIGTGVMGILAEFETFTYSIVSKFFYTQKLSTFPSHRFNFNQTFNFSVN